MGKNRSKEKGKDGTNFETEMKSENMVKRVKKPLFYKIFFEGLFSFITLL